ncbi:DUF2690 domain-containing protein [Dactylosporangium sp. CA-052675]|uniref:DUF2690 domain-containing protein n=1 Tax=Dactylosporangium sp. CA-052675 TaxID=3239927 RepID=UPI003D924668
MLALVLGMTGVVAVQTPALAVTCWGDWCSGQDPDGSGCSADAYTVASARIPGTYTYIELRWSPTCKTNWARVPITWGTQSPDSLRAYQCSTGYTQRGVVNSGGDYSWTAMIYSPVQKVQAQWVGSPGTIGTACV